MRSAKSVAFAVQFKRPAIEAAVTAARLDVVAELRRMADDPHMGATTRALRDAADQLEAIVRGADGDKEQP